MTQYQIVLVQHPEDSKDSACPGQPGVFRTEILVLFVVLQTLRETSGTLVEAPRERTKKHANHPKT